MFRFLPVVALLILHSATPSLVQAQAEPIVILIGGNHSDPSPGQLAGTSGRGGNSGLWRLKGDLLSADQRPAEYFNWNGTRAGKIDAPRPGGSKAIERLVRRLHQQRPEAPIILVGNSWGGHTAWQVCHRLAGEPIEEEIGPQRSIDTSTATEASDRTATAPIESAEPLASDEPAAAIAAPVICVDLLILLDPSSLGRGSEPTPTTLPENVRQAVNFHTRNSFGWGHWLEDRRLRNVDLGDPANGFLTPGGPKYDSALSWRAHVSAEWDERIHREIRQRIVAGCPSQVSPIDTDSHPVPEAADEKPSVQAIDGDGA